ncbi:hypothetical protein ACFYKX_17900 [Cytobacillus sp. FJAT-54145]|uniref:Uncharacterized protein n=1 Tax=Cytobacillus spartinae TaxID=3299023 RepID=A0ABW6KFH1_9BACI
MKRGFVSTIIFGLMIIITGYILLQKYDAKESITFFPIDPSIKYKSSYSTLTLNERKKLGEFSLQWRVGSTLDRDAYLRQDISFLYVNGRLKGKMGEWEENTDQLVQESEISGKESSRFETITFHHSEIHTNNEDGIFSAQNISTDKLYIIDSSFSPLQSFRIPVSKEEQEWKEILDQITNQQLDYSWSKSLQALSLNKQDYFIFPLTDINRFQDKSIPGLTEIETKELVGNLWEGLYKNYFLGIKKRDGTVTEPIDSTIPLIMISNDQSHLLVLIETSSGDSILLRQNLL